MQETIISIVTPHRISLTQDRQHKWSYNTASVLKEQQQQRDLKGSSSEEQEHDQEPSENLPVDQERSQMQA